MADRSPTTAASPPATPTGVDGDWPAQAADTIVRVVGQVRDATTGKVETAARGIVYGLLAGILGGVIAVLFAIAAVRLLDAYLPTSVFGESHTWAAHLVVGILFTGVGMLLYKRRHPKPDDDHR
jgi:hypothetical protein